jgi:hypothetical protein
MNELKTKQEKRFMRKTGKITSTPPRAYTSIVIDLSGFHSGTLDDIFASLLHFYQKASHGTVE